MKWRFDWPVNWRERVVGVILSVTLIGVTVLWVGALVWLVEKFVFGLVRKTTAAQRNWNPRTAPVGGHRGRRCAAKLESKNGPGGGTPRPQTSRGRFAPQRGAWF